VDILLPVFAIKRNGCHGPDAFPIETVHIDTDSIRVGTRHVKRLRTAVATKKVLCDPATKLIGLQKLLALLQMEISLRHDQVQVTAHAANAAIALLGLDIRRCLDLEPHLAAVTSATQSCHSSPPPHFDQTNIELLAGIA
jgi:hypothetical protein